MKCNNCGAEISANAKFCPECGTKTECKKYCPNCGMELTENTKFCPECGTACNGNNLPANIFQSYQLEIANHDLSTDSITITYLDNANNSEPSIASIEFNDDGKLVITSNSPGKTCISMEVSDANGTKALFVGNFRVHQDGQIECLEYHYEDLAPEFESYWFKISQDDLSTEELEIMEITDAETSNANIASVSINELDELIITSHSPGRVTITAEVENDEDETGTFVGTFEVHADGQIECIEYHYENIRLSYGYYEQPYNSNNQRYVPNNNNDFLGKLGSFVGGFLGGMALFGDDDDF